jgi:hypothetical protein
MPPFRLRTADVVILDCRPVVPIGDDRYANRGYEDDKDRVLCPREAAPPNWAARSREHEEDRSC